MKKTNQGFTLIELLVVISIIGLLSSVVLASVSTARQKAANTAATSQIREYQKAIALFYADNGRYPMPGDTSLPVCLGPIGTTCTLGGNVITNTNSTFLGELAMLGELNPNLTKEDGIATAYAASLNKYIAITPVKTPQIIYNNGVWSGASYMCLDALCKDAEVYWPLKNTTTSNTSNGEVKRQRADGGNAATSY